MKHESVSKVHLGADALGNITRINNLLESYPEKLGRSGATIGNGTGAAYKCQRGSWKAIHKRRGTEPETGATVRTKCLLNMDEREDTEAEQSESKEKEERPARGSIHEKLQIYKEKSQRESENGREDRKRDFGLE